METPKRVLRNNFLQNVQKMCTPLKIPASPMMKTLGNGTGVCVYRLDRFAKQPGQILSPWAVKKVTQRFKKDKRHELMNERIQEEAELLRKLSHENIIGYRGIIKNPDGSDSLMLECCKACLSSILEERCEDELGPLGPKETLKVIGDVARGLDYLHTTAKLLHGDLKSSNILIKGDFEICKICDFGVSLPLDKDGFIDFEKNPGLQYVGTMLWSAPEILNEEPLIDAKADIFSFGLIIYETIALVPPHTLELSILECPEVPTDEEKENIHSHNDDDSMITFESACGSRPPLPKVFELSEEYNQIVEIFYLCTNDLPENRPTANAIWKVLRTPKCEAVEKL